MVSIHNSLNIVLPEKPRTPQGWAEADRNRNPKYKFQRWVASKNGDDLYWEATEDLPQEEPHIQRPDFAEWVQWGLNDPTILPDAFFIAVFGERVRWLAGIGQRSG